MNGDQKADVYDQEKEKFLQHFPQIVKVLTEDDMKCPDTGDAVARLREVLEYNAIGGKYQRGLTVLVTLKTLVEPRELDADSLQRALTVGWCVELAGIDGEKEHSSAKKILLDLFGDPSVTGKIGTDIQDNKCSWLVVQCLLRASPAQQQILQKNYGQKEAEKVAQVTALYKELDLPAVFAQYEQDSYNRLVALIEQCASPLPPTIFLRLAQKIYKRKN